MRTRTKAGVWVLYTLVLFVFVYPLWTLVATVFSRRQARLGELMTVPHGLTGANVAQAWHLGVARGLVNSLIVVAVGLTLQLTVSSLAAYSLARKRFKGAGLVLLAILATMMMPEEVIAVPLFQVLGKIHQPFTGGTLVNSYGGLILPLVGWALPVYVLTGFMKRVPTELEEAARIDGAGDFRIFLRIVLPVCRPALGTCAVFGFLMIWDQYLLPLLVSQTPKMDTLTVVVTSLQASQEQGEGVRLAAVLILAVPGVLVYLALQRLFERGLLSGSLKGLLSGLMQSLVERLDGLLYFPVTPFVRGGDDRPGRVDLAAYGEHLRSRLAFLDAPERPGPAAVFACCGTGEFFSLDVDEYADCVRAAAEAAAGRVPVVAGIGYGAALAASFAAAAKESGADGLLVMPPYLVAGGAAGLRDHYVAVAETTDLELIIYQRDNVTFTPEVVADLAAVPNIVGFKDGKGDLDLMQRIVSAVRDRHGEGKLLYLNGLPTAEMSQLAYRGVGVPGYSSAVFCFAPDIALAFYHAYRNAGDGDAALVTALLDRFYRPLVELRHKAPGYAVSLVKAGVRLAGLDAGPVRPPLTEPAPEHVERLAELVVEGRRVLVEHGIEALA